MNLDEFFQSDHRMAVAYGRDLYNSMVKRYRVEGGGDSFPFDSDACELIAEALLVAQALDRSSPEKYCPALAKAGEDVRMTVWSTTLCMLVGTAVEAAIRKPTTVVVGDRHLFFATNNEQEAGEARLLLVSDKAPGVERPQRFPWIVTQDMISGTSEGEDGEGEQRKLPMIVDPFGWLWRDVMNNSSMPDIFLVGLTNPTDFRQAVFTADAFQTSKWLVRWFQYGLQTYIQDFVRYRISRYTKRKLQAESEE